MHANWPHKINDQINRKRQGLPDAGCQRGATAILLFVCMLSLFSTNCPNIIVLHSANTSELQATKKPHNYHKIAVWQKDDRIRKRPLKFYGYYYSILSGDCQASIITDLRTELWRLSVVFCVTLWHMRNSVWFCTRSEWACSPIGRPPTSPILSVRYWIGYSRLGMLLDTVKYPDLP